MVINYTLSTPHGVYLCNNEKLKAFVSYLQIIIEILTESFYELLDKSILKPLIQYFEKIKTIILMRIYCDSFDDIFLTYLHNK
jgi:hypothetical protein